MAMIVRVYEPFAEVHGVEYYSIGTVSEIVGKSKQTIRLWDVWSDKLELNDSERLIPQSCRIGKTGTRCWTEDEIKEIVSFSKNLKYGDIAEMSRTRWGEKSNNLTRDRSTENRQAVKEYRSKVNKDAKKLQNDRKIAEIKQARGNMLNAVRRKARSLIDSVHDE
jgi:DNA-binding transcriptional MerR regulator